ATAPMGTGGTAPLRDKCFHLKGSGPDAQKVENLVCYGGDSYASQKDQAKVKAAIGKENNKDGARTLGMAQGWDNNETTQVKNMEVVPCDCPADVEHKDAGGGGDASGGKKAQ